ncbi:MAG: hypothetical protein ACRDYA_03680 [Egibacteraceae bacterium]
MPIVNGTAGFGNYRLTRPGLWEPFTIHSRRSGAPALWRHGVRLPLHT